MTRHSGTSSPRFDSFPSVEAPSSGFGHRIEILRLVIALGSAWAARCQKKVCMSADTAAPGEENRPYWISGFKSVDSLRSGSSYAMYV